MNFATATIQPASDSVESDCNPTQARLGLDWPGMARPGAESHGRLGTAWQGRARHGRHGRQGVVGPGEARLGLAWQA